MVNVLLRPQVIAQPPFGHKQALRVARHRLPVTAHQQPVASMALKEDICLKTADLVLLLPKCKTAGTALLAQTDLEHHMDRLQMEALWKGNQFLVKQCDEHLWIVTGVN